MAASSLRRGPRKVVMAQAPSPEGCRPCDSGFSQRPVGFGRVRGGAVAGDFTPRRAALGDEGKHIGHLLGSDDVVPGMIAAIQTQLCAVSQRQTSCF
ncbi:MAG: hypothetical protein R6U98_10010 [Pirellulaceae bacterium]